MEGGKDVQCEPWKKAMQAKKEKNYVVPIGTCSDTRGVGVLSRLHFTLTARKHGTDRGPMRFSVSWQSHKKHANIKPPPTAA